MGKLTEKTPLFIEELSKDKLEGFKDGKYNVKVDQKKNLLLAHQKVS